MPNPIAPLVVIEPPLLEPSPYGLVASGQLITESNERWLAGFSWDPQSCVSMTVQSPANLIDTDDPLSNPLVNPSSLTTIYPWMMELALDRITWGFEAYDYPERVRRWVENCTSKTLEAEFWSGSLGVGNQDLASTTDVIAGDHHPVQALALLEQALADAGCGGRGMIHVSPELITHWTAWSLIERDGSRLVTSARRTVVVSGSGYPTSGPTASPDGAASNGYAWAFATGMCQVRLSDITVSPETFAEALDRKTNELTFRAWRYGAVNFDPCVGPVAVRADLTTGY